MTTANLYYEAHVTIEPVFGELLHRVKAIAIVHGFRVADLIMKKSADETGEASRIDTFCSTRGTNLEQINAHTVDLCVALRAMGLQVLRAKVEDTVWDTRIDDPYRCL